MNRADHIEALAAVDALAKALREALNAEARAEYESQGTVPSWRLPGFTVATSLSADSAVIVDDAEFKAYVADAFPTEVETVTVTRVRPAWQAVFLKELVARGEACDGDGRVVAGVEIRPGGAFGSVSVIPNAETRDRLRAAAREIASGARPLALPSLPVPQIDRLIEASSLGTPEASALRWDAFNADGHLTGMSAEQADWDGTAPSSAVADQAYRDGYRTGRMHAGGAS